MGTGMKLTYSDFCVRDVKGVISLCNSWWYDSEFFKNTKMPFQTREKYWWDLFLQGVMMGRVGKDEKDEIRACYVAMKQPYMFNETYIMGSEVVWCIHKEYRDGRTLIQLLNEIEECNKNNNTAFYNLNLPVLEDNDRLILKLEEKGFLKQDISMSKKTNITEKANG